MFQALCQQHYKDQFSKQVRYFYPHFTDEESHMGRMNYPVKGYKAKSRDPNRLKIYLDTHLVIYAFANFIYIYIYIHLYVNFTPKCCDFYKHLIYNLFI